MEGFKEWLAVEVSRAVAKTIYEQGDHILKAYENIENYHDRKLPIHIEIMVTDMPDQESTALSTKLSFDVPIPDGG